MAHRLTVDTDWDLSDLLRGSASNTPFELAACIPDSWVVASLEPPFLSI